MLFTKRTKFRCDKNSVIRIISKRIATTRRWISNGNSKMRKNALKKKKREREENNKRKKREDLADIQIMRTVYDVEYKMDRRASTFFPDGARGIYRSLFWQGGIARTKEVLREYLIYTENTRASDRGKKCNFAESFLRSPTLWASAGTRSVHDDLVGCVSDDNFRMLSRIL